MKPTFLIFILVILGLCDCCWARKKDPAHALLDGNRAKNFLLHRRKGLKDIFTRSLWEECCDESCDAEEVSETMGHTAMPPESYREKYTKENC